VLPPQPAPPVRPVVRDAFLRDGSLPPARAPGWWECATGRLACRRSARRVVRNVTAAKVSKLSGIMLGVSW
jgi:hypothetical protein